MVPEDDTGGAAERGKADPNRPGVGESHDIDTDSRRWKAILRWIATQDPDAARAYRVALLYHGVRIEHHGAPMMLLPWQCFEEPCPE